VQIVAAIKPRPGLKKNFKKKQKNACFLYHFSVLYVYMIKKNDLQTRIENAKKRMCLTLLDIFSIILTQTKENTLCQK
jgi:hypothetical protein